MATTIRFFDGGTITVSATGDADRAVIIDTISAAGTGSKVKLGMVDAAALIASIAVAMAEAPTGAESEE